MFYYYHQNNSGGYIVGEENVIVEADSCNNADNAAESSGLVNFGADYCECCGPRWSGAYNGTESPEIYGKSIVGMKKDWFGDYVIVVKKDGSQERIEFK